jgi:serine/threonine protein phosphatase 1
VIVIGDIHGCYKTFMALLEKLPQNEPICIVGDLIDRGKYSDLVVQYVKEHNIPCVMGNHEDMANTDVMNWKRNGGNKTLDSYGTSLALLYEHLDWFKTLPLYLEFKDIKDSDGRYLVVSHACIINWWDSDVEKRVGLKSKENVLWNRDPIHFLKERNTKDIFNIFGHTPIPKPEIDIAYANIDTGCVFNKEEEYGTLTALQYPEIKIFTQKNIED